MVVSPTLRIHHDYSVGDTAVHMDVAVDVVERKVLEWDWDEEHKDRKLEAKSDGDQPFQVDRRLLKDVVRERMDAEVARIKFLSSGTFHKAYLVTLVDSREVVARVARRFMPRLKTDSEVATLNYLRLKTDIPVPTVYHHDSNPYNRLGGEYIIMSKANGIPLASVYHSMSHDTLVSLVRNVASLLIPLFGHRFSHIGSLYSGSPTSASSSGFPTPKPATYHSYPFTPNMNGTPRLDAPAEAQFHVGPIISWPFFGSGRGELTYLELDRGPWRSTYAYLRACAEREIQGIVRENEGRAAPHKLHRDPDEEAEEHRHRHRLAAIPGDESDDSEDDFDTDSEEDLMYRDYRSYQRSSFLVTQLVQRETQVRAEMERFITFMERLGVVRTDDDDGGGGLPEDFGLDCHDLNLENVFVDEHDNSKITCIIDWESTTTRPLWQCAHLPAFLQSSPFTARLFLDAVGALSSTMPLAATWLHHEAAGAPLRAAHKVVEWDGWEEGLVESVLGPEGEEEEIDVGVPLPAEVLNGLGSATLNERILNGGGDICGGRGGELGRRLEALLVNGISKGVDEEKEHAD